MTKRADDFFIGWSAEAPKADRRFLLGAGGLLLAGAVLGGAASGARSSDPGPGSWDQAGVGETTGLLVADPYPALIHETDNGLRTAFLASNGKLGVAGRLPKDLVGGAAVVRGTLIKRGERTMIALADAPDAIRPPSPGFTPPVRPKPEDMGESLSDGEILDAKCWFGAMRPGWGKTHKSCAALCARGGLPLAWCTAGACGVATDAPLFLDVNGRPHAPAILPWVADPVLAKGRLWRVGDVTQFRVALTDLRRL